MSIALELLRIAAGPMVLAMLAAHFVFAIPLGLQLDRLAGGNRVLNLVLAWVVPVVGVVIVAVRALVASLKRVRAELTPRPPQGAFVGRDRLARDTGGRAVAFISPIAALIGLGVSFALPWFVLAGDGGGADEKFSAFDLGFDGTVATLVFFALIAVVITVFGTARWSNAASIFTGSSLVAAAIVMRVALDVLHKGAGKAQRLVDWLPDEFGGRIDIARLHDLHAGVAWWVVLIAGLLTYVWSFVAIFVLGSLPGRGHSPQPAAPQAGAPPQPSATAGAPSAWPGAGGPAQPRWPAGGAPAQPGFGQQGFGQQNQPSWPGTPQQGPGQQGPGW